MWCSCIDEMSMLRSAKSFLWMLLLLASGLQAARAFVPGGPIGNGAAGHADTWQTAVIGYGLGGDLLAPKNIGEEYRRNIPVLFYSYNANFLDFFGSNGVVAVDAAFALVNNAFTNNPTGVTNGLDGYSTDLREFADNAQSLNFQAQALGLTDLKSTTMYLLMEQLGLANPDRYVWTLHDRILDAIPGAKCPLDELYLVVQRNLDVVNSPLTQEQYSSYINDTLYTYDIEEACTGPNPLAITVPFAVDPFAQVDQALASFGLNTGGFYTGLTRDDAGGLRYLLTTNNINFETSGTGSLLMNPGTTELLTSLNISDLLAASLTNDPALIPGLFPGVTVAGSTNIFTVVCTPNVVSYFTNKNGSPAGSAPQFIVTTNGQNCVAEEIFTDTFGNVVTNGDLAGNPGIILDQTNIHLSFFTNTPVVLQTVTIVPKNGQPFPAPLVTKTTTTKLTLTNSMSGEYLVIPAGDCGLEIVSTLLTNVVATTNFLTIATNFTTTTTNGNGLVGSVSIVTLFTNHTFLVRPIVCAGTGTGLYEGIQKVQFVRADFDSLLGQTFQPITTNYTMTTITHGQTQLQRFQRVVTAPDILFTADDQASPNDPVPHPLFGVSGVTRNINFDQGNILADEAGPGVINSPTTISFDKVGDVFENGSLALFELTTNAFLNELTGAPLLTWGSFDDSTNDPVIYPNGTSIANLENEVLIQVSPTSLSDAAAGAFYTQTFSATGGGFSEPFTWSASGLPPGLSMTTNPDGTGTLSGTPTESGTFDITIELTDSLSRSVQWNYTINIF
jgi:hypothetical protein